MLKRHIFIIFTLLLSIGSARAVHSDISYTVEVSYDTICWTPLYQFKGAAFTLPDYRKYPVDSFMNVILEYRDKCECKKYIHKLAIVPLQNGASKVYHDTIIAGEFYDFYGDTLTESGVYQKTLTGLCNCREYHTLYLTVLNPVTIEDSLAVCENELPYIWNGAKLTHTGTYVYTEPFWGSDKDSLTHILHLTVHPTYYATQNTTIYQGDTVTWSGKKYTQAGTYIDSLQTIYGCDSISILNLTITPNIINFDINFIPTYCADDSTVLLTLNILSGVVDQLSVNFDSTGISAGLRDTTFAIPSNGEIILHHNGVRAGIYTANIKGFYHQIEVFAKDIELTFLYPSSVIEQKWNDVLIVLTNKYNGGYDFTAFQWYKNGNAIPSETKHYLNQPLDVNSEYTVLLTEANGTQMMTCPFYASYHADISLYPTVVNQQRIIHCRVSEAAEIHLYSTTGELISYQQVNMGKSSIQVPDIPGVYIAKIITQSGQKREVKILVL